VPPRKDSRLLAMRPDGGAALVLDGPAGALVEVSLADGASRALLHGAVTAATYVDSERVAVRTSTEIVVLRLGEDGAHRLSALETPGPTHAKGMVALRDGQLLIVDQNPPVVFAVAGARIEVVSTGPLGKTENLYVAGDRVFGATPNMTHAEEIVNLDAALARFLARPGG
jgi:hypothetical protein